METKERQTEVSVRWQTCTIFIVINVATGGFKFSCRLCDHNVKLLAIRLLCIYQVCKHNWCGKFLLNVAVLMREVAKEHSWGLPQLWVSISFQQWFWLTGFRLLLQDTGTVEWFVRLPLIDWLVSKVGKVFPCHGCALQLGLLRDISRPSSQMGFVRVCGPSVCGGLPFTLIDWHGAHTAAGKPLCCRDHLGSLLALSDCHRTLMRSGTSARCNERLSHVMIVGRLCLRKCAQQMWKKPSVTITVCLEILTALTVSCYYPAYFLHPGPLRFSQVTVKSPVEPSAW